MFCPFCQNNDTRVIDSRVSDDGVTIRRRRVCEACGERFSTIESVELKLPTVIKSDDRREPFSSHKVRVSFDRALQKRPVSEEQVEKSVRNVVYHVRRWADREIPSRTVGEYVMAELRKVDHVAYVRFASVYRSFEDVADFRDVLDRLEHDQPLVDAQLPLLGEEDDKLVPPSERVQHRKSATGTES